MTKIITGTISQNSRESEKTRVFDCENGHERVINLANFVDHNANAKSQIQALIRHISREVNRHKLDYSQLKYIFRSVRERCGVVVTGTKRRKLYELPSQDELNRFYGVIRQPIHRLIFEVMENTGLRVAELCNLEVKRIDPKTNLIFVNEGKGKKDRVTVIGNRILEKIMVYLDGKKNRYLFESNRHSKYSPRRIQQLCEQYRAKAVIEKEITPHTLRHIWNTRLAEAGLSKERRMILAGHSSEKVQEIYTHLAAGGFSREVVAMLDSARQ